MSKLSKLTLSGSVARMRRGTDLDRRGRDCLSSRAVALVWVAEACTRRLAFGHVGALIELLEFDEVVVVGRNPLMSA